LIWSLGWRVTSNQMCSQQVAQKSRKSRSRKRERLCEIICVKPMVIGMHPPHPVCHRYGTRTVALRAMGLEKTTTGIVLATI